MVSRRWSWAGFGSPHACFARITALIIVSVFANLGEMPHSVEYFNERVLAKIEQWPVGVLADYARLIELLMEFGPDLRIARRRLKEVRDG